MDNQQKLLRLEEVVKILDQAYNELHSLGFIGLANSAMYLAEKVEGECDVLEGKSLKGPV